MNDDDWHETQVHITRDGKIVTMNSGHEYGIWDYRLSKAQRHGYKCRIPDSSLVDPAEVMVTRAGKLAPTVIDVDPYRWTP